MNLGVGEVIMMSLFALFYGTVISAIVISFWKIHTSSREIGEIKAILIEMKGTLEKIKK